MRRVTRLIAAVLALASVAAGSGCATATSRPPGCAPNGITAAPATTRPGGRVTVIGSASSCAIEFTDDRWYRLQLAYARWDVTADARVRVAANGAFRTTMRVPSGAPPGRPVISVIAGYRSPCGDGGACAGLTTQVTVDRPAFTSPDLRALQSALDASSAQRGRLTTGGDPSCLILDRPWTTDLDLTLPAGWRRVADEVLDERGGPVARIGDDVRIGGVAPSPRSAPSSCARNRTSARLTSMRAVAGEGPPPPGGRLVVGTDTALARIPADAGGRTGTLIAERHRDYLCVLLDDGGDAPIPLAFPPGLTALPNGTLLDAGGTPVATVGSRITAVTTTDGVETPVGCPTGGTGLGISTIRAAR